MWNTSTLDKLNKPVKKLTKAEQEALNERNRVVAMTWQIPCVVEFVLPKGCKKDDYPFSPGVHYLLMGEIRNMRGHCIIVDKQGKTWWGYHLENFKLVEDDD